MRNIITNSSIANVTRFSGKATVMLRGIPATTWRPIDCAGTNDDGLQRQLINAQLEPSFGLRNGKPEPMSEYRLVSSKAQQVLHPAIYTFQRLS